MDLKICFKTKGGHKEGMGDVTSSIALAEEFRSKSNNILFIINNNQNVINLISQKGFKYNIYKNLEQIEEYLNEDSIDIAILNQLNTMEEEALLFRKKSQIMVTIDDTGKSAGFADLSVNALYPIENSISDFRFIALPSTFQKKHHIQRKTNKRIENLLVTQGGSDTYGFTPKIVKSLFSIPKDISVNIILGPNFSHNSELAEVRQKAPREFNIIRGKTDLSDFMLDSDLAVSAGGISLFELACLGVPTLVVCGERFEVKTAKRLEREGFGLCLGFGEEIEEKEICNAVNRIMWNFKLRSVMNLNGKNLIDGKGIKRIKEEILKKYHQSLKKYRLTSGI